MAGNVKIIRKIIVRYEDQLAAEGVRAADYRRNVPPLENLRRDDSLGDDERRIYEALCRDEVPVVSSIFYEIVFSFLESERDFKAVLLLQNGHALPSARPNQSGNNAFQSIGRSLQKCHQ